MENLFLVIVILSFPMMAYFGIRAIISLVRKNKAHGMRMLKLVGVSVGVMIVSAIAFAVVADPVEVVESDEVVKAEKKQEVAKVKEPELTDEEKAAIETKKKEEAEAKKVVEAAKKAEEEAKKKEEAIAKAAAAKKAEEELVKAEAAKVAKEKADAIALAAQVAKEKADKKASAKTIPYAQLKKNPDRYTGEYVKYTGEIIQILEGDDLTNIRMSVTKSSYGYDFNELVFVEYAGYTDFVDGDIVTIYGEIYGSYSYESQAGYNISLPGILAEEVVSP